jgi:TolB protein
LRIVLGVTPLALAAVVMAAPTQLAELRDPREVHLANVRQLTFGGDNAEAYWSFSGKKLIFQSTHGEMKADQIFTMDSDGSNVKMVSTGKGRTTCSYFLKGDKEIIYASTHTADPEPPTPPDRSQGYVWGIFDTFAIYKANADGSNLRPLFPKEVGPGVKTGYNAEATVSPDGKRIIFTSTKDGDLDLYTMKTDGTDVRRITREVGYDGGAYFSPDSKRIVWRAGRPETEQEKADYLRLLKMNLVRPSKLEIWVADADGSNARQVTRNGKANFAPFFTPDGKRILFASNFEDPRGRKFELYLIGIDGTGLKRVTFGEQFDSFPMFSPNGKKLVWASNRHGKNNETNIFVADWVEPKSEAGATIAN